jgi:hypothetical protein
MRPWTKSWVAYELVSLPDVAASLGWTGSEQEGLLGPHEKTAKQMPCTKPIIRFSRRTVFSSPLTVLPLLTLNY